MRNSKYKIQLLIVVVILILIGGFFIFKPHIFGQRPTLVVNDFKNAEYTIEGQRIKLVNGIAETDAAPGSASKIVTKYFGNDLKTDLDGDGREDVAFILTQETGGSGTFFYAVGARATDQGFVGSEGYLLGDRIAPQTIEVSQNPRHKNVVVFNYADRNPNEPMTTKPSLGKSIYLKLNPTTMRWDIIEPNFEGESTNGIHGVAMLGPRCPVLRNPPDPQCADKPYTTSLSVTSADQSKVLKTFSTNDNGEFKVDLPPGEYAIRSAASANILPRCRSQGTFTVKSGSYTEVAVSCDTGIR